MFGRMSKPILQEGPALRRRRRWTAAEKAACLTALATSGRSTTAFCRETGVPRATLRLWQRAARASEPVVPRFAVVEVVPPADAVPAPPVTTTAALTLVVRGRGGIEAAFTGLDAASAAALLQVVVRAGLA